VSVSADTPKGDLPRQFINAVVEVLVFCGVARKW
jgi:hypothetical protein